jgi:anti-sigma-K factor RskA
LKHEQANDEVRELAALFVLGALSEHEAKAFEHHLSEGCAVCKAELAEFARVGNALSFSAVPVTPPPSLRDSLLNRISVEPQFRKQGYRPATKASGADLSRAKTPILAWAIAASLLIVSIASLSYWRRSNNQLEDLQQQVAVLKVQLIREVERTKELTQISDVLKKGARVVTLTPLQEARPPAVDLYLDAPNNRWFVSANLEPLPEGKVYQLWFVTSTEKRSAGLISTDENGHGFTTVTVPPDIGKIDAAAITLEPAGGSSEPTMPILALGKLG